MESYFPHERLDCYRLAVGIARWVQTARIAARGDLADQAARASQSIVLNIAEGAARGGPAGKNHFRIAAGSAGELSAVLDLVTVDGAAARQAELRRIGAMLRGLSR